MSVHPEQQYVDAVRNVIDNGFYRPSPHQPLPSQPNPPGTYSLMNINFSFDLSTGIFPCGTLKPVNFKAMSGELIWMMSGSTDIKDLHGLGVHFWDPWDTPETNQAMGWKPGQLGPIYGKQWRHFGARMPIGDGSFSGDAGEGFDQLTNLVQMIRDSPSSKRLFVSSYDPIDAIDCFVTTCHGTFFCQVWGDRLNLHMIQRSGDLPIGVPYNIASYALLLNILAHVTGLKPGTLHITISDAHVYENQVDAMRVLLKRRPKPYPRLWINQDVKEFDQFKTNDFGLIDYRHHPALAIDVAT